MATKNRPRPAIYTGSANAAVQRLNLPDTNKDKKVTAVFDMESATPVVHHAITGRNISGIGLCLTFPVADLVLTVRRLSSIGVQRQVPARGNTVLNMDITKPIIMPKS